MLFKKNIIERREGRHMHRFDSMCAFDFNKSALELSFLVVARGFVLSWVGCLSSLSVSARRAYARAAGGKREGEDEQGGEEEERRR